MAMPPGTSPSHILPSILAMENWPGAPWRGLGCTGPEDVRGSPPRGEAPGGGPAGASQVQQGSERPGHGHHAGQAPAVASGPSGVGRLQAAGGCPAGKGTPEGPPVAGGATCQLVPFRLPGSTWVVKHDGLVTFKLPLDHTRRCKEVPRCLCQLHGESAVSSAWGLVPVEISAPRSRGRGRPCRAGLVQPAGQHAPPTAAPALRCLETPQNAGVPGTGLEGDWPGSEDNSESPPFPSRCPRGLTVFTGQESPRRAHVAGDRRLGNPRPFQPAAGTSERGAHTRLQALLCLL